VLLYDLTSTYFESDPPQDENDKRRFGYSRDKRSDCVQVVIALIVTPQGFPLAYEVLAGNTLDKTTLREFLQKIEPIRKAERIWLMDRGIPTEECWRKCATVIRRSSMWWHAQGTLTRLESNCGKALAQRAARSESELLAQQGELYVLAESHDRIARSARCAGGD